MPTEMWEKKPDLHEVTVIKSDARVREELASGRGSIEKMIGPDQGSESDMHLIELRPDGPPGRLHIHPRSDNIYLVLSGVIALHVPPDVHLLGPGDTCLVRPGVPHRVAVSGDEPARLIEIYSRAPIETEVLD